MVLPGLPDRQALREVPVGPEQRDRPEQPETPGLMVPQDRPEPLVLRELMAQSVSLEQPELPVWQEALQSFLTAPVFRYH